jgi:transcriptional regulator with XRE-family HTH domain
MVRKRQGVTLRTAARQWNLEISQVRQLEQASSDLTLSQLYAWQQLLNVPIAELLVDCDQPLSAPVMQRAQLLRLMKTAMSLQKFSDSPAIQRLSTMLKEQLVEIMPELEDVGPWQGGDPDSGNRHYEPVRYSIPRDWSRVACSEESK